MSFLKCHKKDTKTTFSIIKKRKINVAPSRAVGGVTLQLVPMVVLTLLGEQLVPMVSDTS